MHDTLEPYGKVKSISGEKWRVPGMENMQTLNRDVVLVLGDGDAISDTFHHSPAAYSVSFAFPEERLCVCAATGLVTLDASRLYRTPRYGDVLAPVMPFG